jgi:hypothetical protein
VLDCTLQVQAVKQQRPPQMREAHSCAEEQTRPSSCLGTQLPALQKWVLAQSSCDEQFFLHSPTPHA